MGTEALHVFVEGCVEPTPEAISRVAAAMSQRYGLGAADLEGRLTRGRFRVKANVDRATALHYVTDLTAMGANVVIVDANTGLPVPAAQLQAAAPKLPPVRPAAASASGLGAAPGPKPSVSGQHQAPTGLAAALSAGQSATDLGALGGDNVTFSLANLDGSGADSGVAPAAAAPPMAAMMTPLVAPPEAAPPPRPGTAPPVDAFAPPDELAEQEVTLAEEAPRRASREVKASPTSPPGAASRPSGSKPAQGASAAPPELLTLADPAAPAAPARPAVPLMKRVAAPRVRLAAGVVLAIVVGFVPASIIASIREASADDAIDARVRKAQLAADTPNAWEGLDGMRANMLKNKRNARREIAVTSMAIWAVVGGAVAFGWFKKIRWDKHA